MGVGGEKRVPCVPRAENERPELLAGSWHCGQGPPGGCPPKAHQPSAGGGGVAGALGEMTLERRGETNTCHLSVPCGRSLRGIGSAKESLAC